MSGAGDSLKWYHVCSTLELLPTVKRPVRQQRLKTLFEAHRKKDSEIRAGRSTVPSGPHMYSLVRLLLPQLDRDEQGSNVLYNMKEAGIARVFVDALVLKGTESEVRLKAWKKPEGGEGYGHFAVVLYHQLILPGRSHHEGKQLTVAQVNEFIDGMAAVSGNHEEQKKLVKALSVKASAFELKWIAKVLLRELRASATEELVYAAYHPDASELFKVDGRMREVVEKCRDPDKRIGDACIEVGKPFNPMLAEKTQDLEKIVKVFKQKGFWIEPKVPAALPALRTSISPRSADKLQLRAVWLESCKILLIWVFMICSWMASECSSTWRMGISDASRASTTSIQASISL